MNPTFCKLPNLIVAGVHKAGTTSLYSYLAKHPQICASFTKEIGFFMPLMFGNSMPAIETYSQYFGHCGAERFRMEASPGYMYGGKKIAEAIKRELGDVKIIIILRDPADRLISLFSREVSNSALPKDTSLDLFVSMSEDKMNSTEYNAYSRGIREGIYFQHVEAWQTVFGDDLRILFFEDLKTSAFDLTVSACSWLGLEADCYVPDNFTVENKTVHYRHRKLHRYVRDVYMSNEVFWRKHGRIKQRLRKIYNAFNAGTTQKLPTIDDEAVSRLRTIFEPHNRELKSFLEAHNYTSLPAWLS